MKKFKNKKQLKRNLSLFIILVVLPILAVLFSWESNNLIDVTSYSIDCPQQNFKGYKIAFLSDLHIKKEQALNSDVINKCDKANPDIIVISGDIVDRTVYNEQAIINFSKELGKIAPVYWTTGNHEAAIESNDLRNLTNKLKPFGFKLLNNENVSIKKGDEELVLIGINDPLFGILPTYSDGGVIDQYINIAKPASLDNKFSILIFHRTEYCEEVSKSNFSLILTGHAHGGQVRIPFIGGLFSPGQGFFPRYTSGKIKFNNSEVIINRGIGNSRINQRIFNNPQIILINLK